MASIKTKSQQTLAILREIVAVWPKVRTRILAMQAAPGAEIASNVPESSRKPSIPTNPDGSTWFKIKSSSSVGTNQWNYKGRVMKSGDTSSYTGLVETADTTEFDLRSSEETVEAIPDDTIVRGWPEVRNGSRVYVILTSSSGSSISRMKVASVPGGSDYITAKTWDGTTLGDTAVRVIPVMGHAVNDIIYAAQSNNGTEVTDTDWVEVLICDPTTDRYKVMQAIDTTGRLGMDWVRAH